MRSDKHVPYLFLAPALLGLVLFRLYPIFLALWESLFVTGFGPAGGRSFVGLENFQFLFEDFVFWRSVKATAILTIIINPVQIALALGLALLLQRKSRNIRLIRSLFLLPIGVALPIATVIWGLMLNPNQGLINGMLDVIGVSPQPFLTSEAQAIWAIVLIATWKGVAFWMLFLLAGLEDIPKSLYEAIRVDGANWFGRLRYVTMPLLRRTLLFVLVADTAANFVLIVPMIILTQGGPRQTTNVLMYEAYRSGFIFQDFGRSMAIVTLLTAITLAVIALQVLVLGDRRGQDK
ncbi:MAG: sugar ABC transporter permease [Albidovulum sp.]|nr:sugar ABC transporter permease [Albidovulum sp.]